VLSAEDLSDTPHTTPHLVHDSMTLLAGRVTRRKSKHAHAESPRSRTRRQITNVRVWQGPSDLFVRSVFDVIRVRGGMVDRYVGLYEHHLLPSGDPDTPWLIGRRRVLIDHNIEAGGGSVSSLPCPPAAAPTQPKGAPIMTVLNRPRSRPAPATPPRSPWVVEDIAGGTFRVDRTALADEGVFRDEMRAIFDRC